MKSISIRIGNFKVYMYVIRYRNAQKFITPAISVDCVRWVVNYFDTELKFLCFGCGIRFVKIKS